MNDSSYFAIGSIFGVFFLYFLLRPMSSSPSLGRRVFQLGGMALCLLTLLPGTAGKVFATFLIHGSYDVVMMGLPGLLVVLFLLLIFVKEPQTPPESARRKFWHIPQFSLQELTLMVISIAVAPGVIPLLLPEFSGPDELQFLIAVLAVITVPLFDLALLQRLETLHVPFSKTRSALLFLFPFLLFFSLHLPARLFYLLKTGRLEQGAGVAETICQISVQVLIICAGAVLLRRARVLADAGREKPPVAIGSQEKR